MPSNAQLDPAATAYDCLAPYYDSFTAGYAHDQWVGELLEWAGRLGCSGRRALDLACGTGASTVPLAARGFAVTGCDISEGMVRAARRNHPEIAERFLVADMRELPCLGSFDLILCLDDAVNYLLSEAELSACFAGVARALAPGGLFAFDCNTLATYRSSFAQAIVRESHGLLFAWRGEESAAFAPAGTAAAVVEVFAERDDGLWERRSSRHIQRHHGVETIGAALRGAGLACRAVAGQQPRGRLEPDPDEERHIKFVCFAGLADGAAQPEEVSTVDIISP
jgi:SAM-dependent methyltransferase